MPFAKDGCILRVSGSADWRHNGRHQDVQQLGLMDPTTTYSSASPLAWLLYEQDPEAPNYDPVHKIIRPTWRQRGPVIGS